MKSSNPIAPVRFDSYISLLLGRRASGILKLLAACRGRRMEPLGDETFRLIYQYLRDIARAKLSSSPGHTLQPTAVVHEALLRLSGRPDSSFNDEQHYIATAAQAIRQVLVDHARRKSAAKRGADAGRSGVAIDDSAAAAAFGDVNADLALDLNAALEKLEARDGELATIVKLKFFANMTAEEIAGLLGVARKTIERRWQFAAALLRTELKSWSENAFERRAPDSRADA